MDGSTHPPPKKTKQTKLAKIRGHLNRQPHLAQNQRINNTSPIIILLVVPANGVTSSAGDPLRNSVYRGSGKSDNIHLHPGGFPRRGAHNPAPFRNVPRAVTQQDEPPRKITYEPRRVALRKPYFAARLRARNVARATAAELPPKRRPRYCLLPLSSFSGRDAGRGAVRSTVHLPARTDPNLLA